MAINKIMGWDEVFYNVISDWLVTVHFKKLLNLLKLSF